MRVWIYFCLKKKGVSVKDFLLNLTHFDTSDSDELDDGISDGYGERFERYHEDDGSEYGYYKPVTEEMYRDAVKFYESQIEDCKKSIAEYEKELAKSESLLTKAETEVAAKSIKDDINECSRSINFYNQELQRFTHLYNKLTLSVGAILDANESIDFSDDNHKYINDYEVVYWRG